MSIGFFLATPQAEVSSIKMIVRHNHIRYARAVGISVITKMWNKKSQKSKVTQDYRDGGAVNFEIQRYRSAIERLIENNPQINDNKHFWALVDCELKGRAYDAVNPSNQSFVEYFETIYIRRFLSSKSETRIKRFKVALVLLKKFEHDQGRSYKFSEINITFYRDLEAFFTKERYSPNYFGSIVKVIKQIMREAIDVDQIHNNNEFRSANFKATAVEVDNVYLTDEELKRIHALVIDEAFIHKLYPLSKYSGLASHIRSYTISKNLFLIGAYTGLRLSDFKRLNAEHFSGDRITIVTEKTGARVVIPVHPIIKEILSSGFDFSESLSEQKIRTYIKHICEAAGITEIVELRRTSMGEVKVERLPKYQLVSTHTARRSFATNAYKAGVPTLAIMKITGHTKESTFLKYIKISSEENANILADHAFFK